MAYAIIIYNTVSLLSLFLLLSISPLLLLLSKQQPLTYRRHVLFQLFQTYFSATT